MVFCIRETGETREIYYPDSKGIDWSNEIAQNNGLLADDSVTWSDELDAYVAPREVVEYWEEYFEVSSANDQELSALKNEYDSDEVESLYFKELSGGYYEPDEVSAALVRVRKVLEKRYNLDTAQYIGENCSNLPQSDFRYFKETLYRQNTGEFFLTGEGGPMTRYGMSQSDGSMSYGEHSIPLTKRQAQAWVAENCDKNTYITLFGT